MNLVGAAVLFALSLTCAAVGLAFARDYGKPASKAVDYYLRSVGGSLTRSLGLEKKRDDAQVRKGERLFSIGGSLTFFTFSLVLLIGAVVRLF